MQSSLLLTVGKMTSHLGIDPQTLRRWERQGKLSKPKRTLSHHRRYRLQASKSEAWVIGYVRVWSHDQKSDLERQKVFLEFKSGKPGDLVMKDLGSGMKYMKSGFKQLLLLLLQGKFRELILTHKDRWLRFGSEIIFQIGKFMGVKITIKSETPGQAPMEQFGKDWVEIVTVFCSKIYGHRSPKHGECSTLNNSNATAG